MATLTSLYLCSRTVYAAVGSPTAGGARITAAAQMQLPEGCLINGVITNEADLADALKAFFAQNKLPASRVALIAGGSQFKSVDFIPFLTEYPADCQSDSGTGTGYNRCLTHDICS